MKELPNNKFGTHSEIYWDDAYFNAQVGAVTHGTAAGSVGRNAAYSIAGKTGTAQVFSVGQNEKYNEKTTLTATVKPGHNVIDFRLEK